MIETTSWNRLVRLGTRLAYGPRRPEMLFGKVGASICSRRSGVGATNNYAMARLFGEPPRTGRLD